MIDIITGTYTINRFSPGEWGLDGKYSKGASIDLSLDACVQPASGNQIKQLPEHRRSSEVNVVYIEERLFISDEATKQPADIFHYDGKRFEVFNVKKWDDETDIGHYECLIVKEDGQGNDS